MFMHVGTNDTMRNHLPQRERKKTVFIHLNHKTVLSTAVTIIIIWYIIWFV